MKIYKIYGKNSVSQDALEETFKIVEENKGPEDVTVFIDMDTSEGYIEALANNIYYLPTVTCEDADGAELGFIEHARENLGKWYLDLKSFVEDLKND